jgi:hypothetical protein
MMSQARPDWSSIVNAILVEHEGRIAMLEQLINLGDAEYAMPGELDRRPLYDLRTGPELAAMRMDDHQARIAALEARLRRVEALLHGVDNYGNALEGADGV